MDVLEFNIANEHVSKDSDDSEKQKHAESVKNASKAKVIFGGNLRIYNFCHICSI